MATATKRLSLSDLHNASVARLTDELAAAGMDSTRRPINELRGDVARVLADTFGPFGLHGEDNEVIREATADETAESVMAGPEGWIVVDGIRCYVAE